MPIRDPAISHAEVIARLLALLGHSVSRESGEKNTRIFKDSGCGSLEVTGNIRRAGAHAFYRKLGFSEPSAYFRREL